MLINNALLFFLISPLYSFIIDLDDGGLEDRIGQEEFEEIRSFSDNLKQILNRLNQKVSS